eukprot:gene3293-13955_t
MASVEGELLARRAGLPFMLTSSSTGVSTGVTELWQSLGSAVLERIERGILSSKGELEIRSPKHASVPLSPGSPSGRQRKN